MIAEIQINNTFNFNNLIIKNKIHAGYFVIHK